MKPYIPQLRIISVDHDRTSVAERRLRAALDAASLGDYPVRSVFCHLESGRCGVPAGIVAVEVDGKIIWGGPELTEETAGRIARRLPEYVQRQMQELGMA